MVLYLFAPRSGAETAVFVPDLVKFLTIRRWIEADALQRQSGCNIVQPVEGEAAAAQQPGAVVLRHELRHGLKADLRRDKRRPLLSRSGLALTYAQRRREQLAVEVALVKHVPVRRADELRPEPEHVLQQPAAEADGNAQADTTFVSVLVDGDGVIQDCLIDCVQTKIAVSAAGEIVTPANTAFDSKIVLDDAYSMRKASPIGAEWDEQAWFFANYVTGKTPAEVAGIALDESTHPTDADITTGCTMAIGAFIAVIK